MQLQMDAHLDLENSVLDMLLKAQAVSFYI